MSSDDEGTGYHGSPPAPGKLTAFEVGTWRVRIEAAAIAGSRHEPRMQRLAEDLDVLSALLFRDECSEVDDLVPGYGSQVEAERTEGCEPGPAADERPALEADPEPQPKFAVIGVGRRRRTDIADP